MQGTRADSIEEFFFITSSFLNIMVWVMPQMGKINIDA